MKIHNCELTRCIGCRKIFPLRPNLRRSVQHICPTCVNRFDLQERQKGGPKLYVAVKVGEEKKK